MEEQQSERNAQYQPGINKKSTNTQQYNKQCKGIVIVAYHQIIPPNRIVKNNHRWINAP